MLMTLNKGAFAKIIVKTLNANVINNISFVMKFATVRKTIV